MRLGITTMGAVAGLLLLSAAGTASASTTTVLRTNVPFAFDVKGRTLPAGKYVIERDDLSPETMIIRGADNHNHAVVIVSTKPDGGRDPAGSQPALTFQRHENSYQLRSIWDSRDEGWDLVAR